MKRRRFLIRTLLAVLPSTPSRAELQRPGKAARIGVLSQLTAVELGPYMIAFREGLRERGYINLKTARALGVTIPPSLLLRADQVVE